MKLLDVGCTHAPLRRLHARQVSGCTGRCKSHACSLRLSAQRGGFSLEADVCSNLNCSMCLITPSKNIGPSVCLTKSQLPLQSTVQLGLLLTVFLPQICYCILSDTSLFRFFSSGFDPITRSFHFQSVAEGCHKIRSAFRTRRMCESIELVRWKNGASIGLNRCYKYYL